MKHMTTFIMSMTATACIFSAGQFVTATDTKLFAGGKTTIDGCNVSGELIRKDDGVYARFLAKNETDNKASLKFNYAASRTTKGSMKSRMIPRPEQIKSDKCEITLNPGESKSVDVLVKTEPRPPEKKETPEKNNLKMLAASHNWTLAVSKEPIKVIAGWGAVIPAKAIQDVDLKNGTAILNSGKLVETAAQPRRVAKNG